MANLLRLALLGVLSVAACWLALVPLKAHAYGVVPQSGAQVPYYLYTGQTYNWPLRNPMGHRYATGRQACEEAIIPPTVTGGASQWAVVGTTTSGTAPNISTTCIWRSYAANDPTCQVSCGMASSASTYGGTQASADCPADSTLTSGQCVCNSGFKAVGSTCQVINCQGVVDLLAGTTLSWQGNTGSTCYGGCKVSCGVRGYLSATNTSSCSSPHLFTDSSSCQGSAAGANTTGNDTGTGTAGATCPTGQCPGTVNGQAVCVPCTNTTQSGPTNSTTAPSGSTAPPIDGAPAGTASSSQETSCTGGKCTTTTTYRDAGGVVTGTRQTEETEGSFCAKNPDLPICAKSAFGGACGSFTCSGDAVQCAQAKEAAALRCKLEEQPSGATQSTYEGLKGSGQADGAFSTSINLPSALPSAPSSSCAVANFTIDLFMGQALEVPLGTRLCPYLESIRAIVVAFGSLAWVLIVFRG